ncbi:unnamed protein product [Fusarium fujikuroi]|uniref:Uncharacterized protein n=1 Tax=Fusarium fujikuroi TaxID=5127 RepID=A0A9Q9RCC7_FUSFU|nr:unnamed protein product [Fusarium fujikuroi]
MAPVRIYSGQALHTGLEPELLNKLLVPSWTQTLYETTQNTSTLATRERQPVNAPLFHTQHQNGRPSLDLQHNLEQQVLLSSPTHSSSAPSPTQTMVEKYKLAGLLNRERETYKHLQQSLQHVAILRTNVLVDYKAHSVIVHSCIRGGRTALVERVYSWEKEILTTSSSILTVLADMVVCHYSTRLDKFHLVTDFQDRPGLRNINQYRPSDRKESNASALFATRQLLVA